MKQEFERYRLRSFRALVGALQLCGAAGLLIGVSQPWIGRMASFGLALLMLLGVGVRIRINDTLLHTTPAIFYFALNAYLYWAEFR